MGRLLDLNLVVPFVSLLITNKKGKVLIIERGKKCDIYKEVFELPGGKVDIGEKRSIDVARREAEEETGLKLKKLKIVDVQFFKEDHERPVAGAAILYRAKAKGKPKPRKEEKGIVKNIKWMSKKKALNLPLTPWSKSYIKQYL